MTRHTPGPWTVPHFARGHSCPCQYVFAGEYLGGIAEVYVDDGKTVADGGNDCPPLEEAKANARLIAASPVMLEALKEALEALEEPDDFKRKILSIKANKKVKAAINKATVEDLESVGESIPTP